jgi:DNA-directed RNA polymerase subunit omega
MARITIEDCMEQVPNRFHLVRMASIRAKQLKKGAMPLLKSEENKHVVMSLREIAAGLVKPGEAEPEPTAPEPMLAAQPESPQAEAAAETPPAEASETTTPASED